MKILALDPATITGWAYWDGTRMISGTWSLKVRPDESADFRLIRLRNKLDEFVSVDRLYFEAAGFTKFQKAAQIAGQLEGVILVWAHDNGVSYKTVKPTELKKWATGKGNANKQMMVSAAVSRTEYWGDEHNEADARLVLAWGLEQYKVKENDDAC